MVICDLGLGKIIANAMKAEMAGKSEKELLQICQEEGYEFGFLFRSSAAAEELKNRGWDMESIKEKVREMRSGK